MYKNLPPQNPQDKYEPSKFVDFDIDLTDDLDINKQSVYISGNLYNFVNKAPLTPDLNVSYDPQAGIHSFFRSISCTVIDNNGRSNTIENISEYPRYCKMYFEANTFFETQSLQNSSTLELRCGTEEFANKLLGGELDEDRQPSGKLSFAFSPIIAINRTANNISNIAKIKLQFTLSDLYQPYHMINGSIEFPDNFEWYMKNLQIHYNVSPKSGNGTNMCLKVFEAKRTIISSNTSLNFQPPALVNSFVCGFSESGLSVTKNQLQNITLPDVQKVDFLKSGSLGVIKFPQTCEEEIVMNYIKAFNVACMESNAIYSNVNNNGYGIGINFIEPINMIKSTFTMTITCGRAFSGKYDAFCFFNCTETF